MRTFHAKDCAVTSEMNEGRRAVYQFGVHFPEKLQRPFWCEDDELVRLLDEAVLQYNNGRFQLAIAIVDLTVFVAANEMSVEEAWGEVADLLRHEQDEEATVEAFFDDEDPDALNRAALSVQYIAMG